MAILIGRNCRVFIDGVDISNYVRGARIDAEVNSAVTTTLELVAGVSLVDGNIRIGEGAPLVSPLHDEGGVTIRAIVLEGQVPVGT